MSSRFLYSMFLPAFMFLLVGRSLAITPHCFLHYNITCDGGSGTLNFPELPEKHKDCDLSLRDKNDTNRELLTPSPNITVLCNVAVIYLKVQCISPKVEFLTCYKLVNETSEPTSWKKDHQGTHRRHEFVIIPVGLFVLVLVLLGCLIKIKKSTV